MMEHIEIVAAILAAGRLQTTGHVAGPYPRDAWIAEYRSFLDELRDQPEQRPNELRDLPLR